ncbi:FAD/NAD(P)-binding domain-containing protein [Parathielavia appendiculata]|uniref:FAD/NAD(P)-binding domain-containing protein n=1 Tax=Parathielavia appendiculata TaxID=2587402 RepID=A0AAN6Z7R3_9PEZI|nr:FAD/NAD(P)-binding domain-containing protein [Parathielavia appendiculata]
MVRTIVILGASYTGVPIAHYLLKHTIAKVESLKVIIVAPNTHMYWNVAAVRGILPGLMDDNKLFLPLAPAFAKYPSDRYELVRGVAERVDPASNIVEVRGNDGSSRTIRYDELVIATGSSFKSEMPFKNLGSTEKTKEALHSWAQRIKSAKSIVVAGAGPTGVEVAGELGQAYGVTGKKQITLICDQDLPFSSKFRREVRETAKKELERLKVKVITGAKVTFSPTPSPSSKTVTISNTSTSEKTTLQVDLVIPTFGIVPNTSYLPPSMLDTRGFVKQTRFLRAEGHADIFVVGDARNLEESQGVHADAQLVHVVKLIEARLLGQGGAAGGVAEYKPADKVVFAATLGPNKGTGQMGNWKIWSWLVTMLKGKHLGTNYAGAFVRGERTAGVKDW